MSQMIMKTHEIVLKDLQNWLETEEVVFASSTRENKKLTCTMQGGLRVFVGNKIIWQGIQPFAAVEKYNSITGEFIIE